MEENKTLPATIKSIIDDPHNHMLISVVTPWEMIIKIKSRKLKVPENFTEFIANGIFTVLPVQFNHVLGVRKLSGIHKDPFDRILIAQAKAEKLILITSDKKIWKYKIKLLKA
jgi:PIN domain nuclease of toxin-antitoxin system